MSAVVDGDADWETWGRTDPYFGVVSLVRFRRATFEEHRAEFFRSGEREVAASLEQLERLFGPVRRGRALDFGCGVGRLALPLARAFDQAVGLGRGRLRDALLRWVRYTRLGNAAANLLRGRPIETPVMQMNGYSAFDVLALLERRGIREVVARPEWHGPHLMLSWLGRTPGA